jgi:hypothetical protein
MVLLDDLDEVPKEHRLACRDLISRAQYDPRWAGVVLCASQDDSLTWSIDRWHRNRFVMLELQSPTSEQVFGYLQPVQPRGARVAAQVASLARDAEFRQWLRVGLVADIHAIAASATTHGQPIQLFNTQDIEDQPNQS